MQTEYHRGKCRCACGWRGQVDDLIQCDVVRQGTGSIVGYIHVCPRCLDLDSNAVTWCCEAPGCWLDRTCGTPTADGYRLTCGEHVPRA